jgi:hypothetical protein
MTLLPSARMKSVRFGSLPSAMNATVTPLPVAICCAVGTLGSSDAVRVLCNASGSSSGFDGSVGQMPGAAAAAARGAALRGVAAGVAPTTGAMLTVRSGSTAATAGSAASASACAAVTVAAKPLTLV